MFFSKSFKIVSPFFIFMLLLTVGGLFFVKNLKNYIKRGVDLVGGTYITLDVLIDKVYENVSRETLGHISKEVLVSIKKSSITADNLLIEYENADKARVAFNEIVKIKLDMVFSLEGSFVKGKIDEKIKGYMLNNAIEMNMQALRKRLDPFGAGEILIARQENRIIIELPNVQDKEQARRLIGTTAHLTIKPVIDTGRSKEELESQYLDSFSDDIIICSDEIKQEWFVLPRHAEITGALLKKANLAFDPEHGNQPVVAFSFNNIGGNKFRELTRENIGKRVAITVDDIVVTAPVVNQEIGASGIIQGHFTAQSAQELSMLLESGAFVAPVVYAQERVIAPILGEKTIEKGIFACFIGMILLFIASVLMYKVSGFVAFIILLYNLLFTLFGIWMIGGTLTLSGIAGLILTIGMAIDASILIFERIKEELAKGVNFKTALENGFSGAMTVIIDANVTHFLVALVLYYVGAGPLKGFAVTMIVGIISTIFSGIFLLKALFKYIINNLGFFSIKI
jgi:preprotein translocase subunit SecD